ncbi:hypothetical protein LKO27_05055 [Tessaracoccus sp. OS52]|uniref:FtsX-like permease family protein n=1 Tax=Tessaracoccus sp. OS52 TaxID=2886691 RepID=UPI001D129EBA|nr:FtsX-like permease family protein [Tessaracoccus sp. OS52]MCC2592784.1 hypothetical protein [Tessaracoccus sp. OS52]
MSPARLLWRQFRSNSTGLVLVSLMVTLMAGLLVAGPRYAANLADAQLGHRLQALSAEQGDVASSWQSTVSSSTIEAYENPWEPYRLAAEAIRQSQPEPLRSILQPAQFRATTSQVSRFTPPLQTGYFEVTLEAEIDPQLREHAELVAGEWPQPARLAPGEGLENVEVTVVEDVARALSWEVGQQIPAGPTVTGIHRPIDVEDSRWQHIPGGVGYTELVSSDRGVALLGSVFLSPESSGHFFPGQPESQQVDLWFGVDLGLASAVDVSVLGSQLTGLLARQYPVPSPQPSGEAGVVEIDLQSELGGALAEVAVQQRTTSSLFLVMAAGPSATGLVLLGLSARFVTHRRVPTLRLAHARGASLPQLRLLAGLEGLVLTLPAAAFGHAMGSTLVAGTERWWEWLPTLLLAGLASGLLALGAGARPPDGSRADLGPGGGRLRIAAEAVLLAVGVAALWRLSLGQRDIAWDASAGPDLLALAAPLLVAIAGCAFAMRLYPLPLRALLAAFRRGRGLVGFLGTARALRGPAGGLVPVFAVVLGTTVASLGTVLLSTVTVGLEEAAWDRNGADVNLSGPAVTDDLLTDLRSLDGVASVSRLFDTRERRRLTSADGETAVTVWVAEPSLTDVYGSATAGLPVLPEGFFNDSKPPVVVAGGSLPHAATAVLAGVGTVEVGAHWGSLPGSPARGDWILIDAGHWLALGGDVGLSRLALVDVSDGADPTAVAEAVTVTAGGGLVTTAKDQLDAARSQPVVVNLGRVVTVVSGLAVAALAGAVVVSHGMGNRERAQLARILGVLGAPPRATGAMAAWELIPVVAVSLVTGLTFGIAIAAILLTSLDFSSLTGGLGNPVMVLNGPWLGLVAAVVAAVTTAAVGVTSWSAARAGLAVVTRTGEDK